MLLKSSNIRINLHLKNKFKYYDSHKFEYDVNPVTIYTIIKYFQINLKGSYIELFYFVEPWLEINIIFDKEKILRESLILSIEKVIADLQEDYDMPIESHQILHDVNLEWYCNNDKEKEIMLQNYITSSRIAMNTLDGYMTEVLDRGLIKHCARMFHIMSNQLGFNYNTESKVLWRRAVACKLFYWFGFEFGRKIYNLFFSKSKY